MTVTIPPELQAAITARAAQRHLTAEDVVREALSWYLHIDEARWDELSAWQEIRDEALEMVEEPAP